MAKGAFMMICISRNSIDYDLLLNYLNSAYIVKSIHIVPRGIFIRILYDSFLDYRMLLHDIMLSDVTMVSRYDILNEEL